MAFCLGFGRKRWVVLTIHFKGDLKGNFFLDTGYIKDY